MQKKKFVFISIYYVYPPRHSQRPYKITKKGVARISQAQYQLHYYPPTKRGATVLEGTYYVIAQWCGVVVKLLVSFRCVT